MIICVNQCIGTPELEVQCEYTHPDPKIITPKAHLYEPLNVYRLADYLIVPELKKAALVPMKYFFESLLRPSNADENRETFWKLVMKGWIKLVWESSNDQPEHETLRRQVVKDVGF